jgi:hypothetical protein
MSDDQMLDELSDGQREFVELCCRLAGLPLAAWREHHIVKDVEILAISRLADRLKRASTRLRSEAQWWKLAGERLGLSTEDAQRVRMNLAARRNRATPAGRRQARPNSLPTLLPCRGVPRCPSAVRDRSALSLHKRGGALDD